MTDTSPHTEVRRPRKFKIIRKSPIDPLPPPITFTLEEQPPEEQSSLFPALTRYLYIHTNVEYTLRRCLQFPHNHTIDEAIFWAYELYHSGYKVETIEILSSIFNSEVATILPDVSSRFQKQVAELINDENKHENIATIVHNLFICIKHQSAPKIWVKYRPETVEKYNHQFISAELPADRFLKTVQRFQVSQSPEYEYDRIITPENWVYYAYYTPLWLKRVHLFIKTMILDHDTETIRFETNGFKDMFGVWNRETEV